MSLRRCRPSAALAWTAALAIAAVPGMLAGRHEENEQELQTRIAAESNPVKKAKLEVRLGTLELGRAESAYDAGHSGDGVKLLDAFRSSMEQSWDLLQATGRDAARKPQGFRELDIALREGSRRLRDLRDRVPFTERNPIQKVAQQADALHTQVLAALFPGGEFGMPPAEHAAGKAEGSPASSQRPGDPHP